MLRKVRILLATVFFVCITLLFVDFTGTIQPYFGWMAKLQFLPSVLALNFVAVAIVVLLTLLVGRIYCSVICPLGVMQDIFAWIGKAKLFRKNKKAKFANKYSYSKPKTGLRLLMLVLFVVMVVSGFNAGFMLLAPYSSYGRIVAAFLQPLYIGINNLLAAWSEAQENYMFYAVDVHDNPAILFAIAGFTAVVLFVLAFMNGRTYCNTICPVGTILGIMSKYSLFKMRVDESACIKCGMCAKNCKAACIDVQKDMPVKIDYSRCVDCGNCELACAKGAIKLRMKTKNVEESPIIKTKSVEASTDTKTKSAAETPTSDGDMSRRAFLGIVGLAAAGAVRAQEKTTDGGFAAIEDKQVPNRKTQLTPPGSLSARHFNQHCTSCQLCIANCPNGVLRPNTSLDKLMQPVMEYEKGYCRPECARCSEVCPTGAIKLITPEEKTAVQIGHAVWVKKNCIPLTDGQTCGNCAKHCPSGAIQMVPIDQSIKINEEGKWFAADGTEVNPRETLSIPVIDTESCIGCGACENLCPARPFSAIYVEGHEVHREI